MGPFSVEFQHLGDAGFSTTPGLPHALHTSLRVEAKMHGDVYFTGGSQPGSHSSPVSGNPSFKGPDKFASDEDE